MTRRRRTKWSDAPIVTIQSPRCPWCDREGRKSEGYDLNRSITSSDGSVARRAICESCSRGYLICVETMQPGTAYWSIDPDGY